MYGGGELRQVVPRDLPHGNSPLATGPVYVVFSAVYTNLKFSDPDPIFFKILDPYPITDSIPDPV